MTKQTIEVEVPEGWKVKEYRMPNKGDYFWHQNRVCVASSSFIDKRLIIEKIQPRRIVLEVTNEERHVSFGDWYGDKDGTIGQWPDSEYRSEESYVIWREVKETDIPLTNEDPNAKSKWAEDLILQLDASHQGRNRWLCHYGRSKQAEEARKTSIF